MDIVIKNALVVTMDEKRRILKNHSIAIDDAKIVEIKEKIKGEAETTIAAKGNLVMPGLINAHTHLAMTLFRGTADDVPLMQWLQEEIWPIENNLNEENVRAGALLGILEMIKSGTTCFNDMYWHLDEAARCVEESGIRAVLSTPLLDVMGPEQGQKLLKEAENSIKKYKTHERITPFLGPHAPYTCSEELLLKTKDLAKRYDAGIHIHVSETKEEVENSKKDKGARPFEHLDRIGFLDKDVIAAHSVWVSKSENSIKKYKTHERITPFLGPHAPYTCSEELLLKTKDLAKRYGAGIHIHVSETKAEVENSKKDKGARPFEYLDRIGFLDKDVIAAHSVWVSKSEIDIIKDKKTKICHNPISNMKLGSGVAPVPEYLEKGITVSLGTDGAASNNNLDMFEDMKICALLHKSHNSNASLVPAMNTLEFATINGAKALGMEDEIGSIETGKKADIIMLDINAANMVPMTNPISHLVYSAQGSNVETVIVDGKVIMKDRQMKTMDENKVIGYARQQAKDLFGRSGKKDHLLGV